MVNRALVEQLLVGRPYPATRDELAAYARREEAPTGVVAHLERLPDRVYRTPNDVGEALFPVEPERGHPARPPRAESGAPPGHEAYVDAGARPGEVRHDTGSKSG